MQIALTTVTVHWLCVTAYLYEQHISTGVIAMIKACFVPALQSSTEQWKMQIALTSVAVHWCWVTAHLHDQQVSIVGIAVTRACFVPALQSSIEQWEMLASAMLNPIEQVVCQLYPCAMTQCYLLFQRL